MFSLSLSLYVYLETNTRQMFSICTFISSSQPMECNDAMDDNSMWCQCWCKQCHVTPLVALMVVWHDQKSCHTLFWSSWSNRCNDAINYDTGEGALHIHSYIYQDTESLLIYMIVLFRRSSWKGHWSVTLLSISRGRGHLVDMIVLLRRWSWNGNSLMTLGKTLLCTFICRCLRK